MPLDLVARKKNSSLPVFLVRGEDLAESGADADAIAWAKANGFKGEEGNLLTIPDKNGGLAGAFFGLDSKTAASPLTTGKLARLLPEGDWHFATPLDDPNLAALGLALGAYTFTRYGKKQRRNIRFAVPEGSDLARIRRVADGVYLTRDLINTPTNDMGPEALENAVRELADRHKAKVAVVKGDQLLKRNFPMIHAVGRASVEAPRLIDLAWGPQAAPKVTLVGKGVCFDTGGLDIKPASGMLLMKKDMGGAANVLGLASMIMAAGLKVRLRVLIPAVENAISGNAFRPGDVLTSRKGITVEIGNTDAEGRLVLADALALADEEAPEILID
ncbi:MAG TPA: leucyl aminopeptidase family protein, partial [Rhizobiaceae bacterium]|nr:leucyl aminopeptidase family protein [Rhizobiaceae bacterium]